MSFKRSGMDEENIGNDNDNDVEPFQKRQRFDDFRGRGGRGRGRGGRDRGGGGRGFRGRGGFNRSNDDDGDDENGGGRGRGRGGFNNRGRGGFNSRGRGGFNNRGRGRGDGNRGFRGGGRGRGDRGRGRGGGAGGPNNFPQKKCAIKVGQNAPDFNNILNQKSESISLKQFKGKYVVLFIYFQDGKWGSKAEQENFRDLQQQFENSNAVILGVSRDDATSHSNAASEGKLNYSLLADTKGEVTKAYDAIENERVFNSTFIISPEGKIAAVWPQVFGPDRHPQEVLNKLKKIINGETDENEETKQDADNEDDEREAVDENNNDEDAGDENDNEEAGDENDNDDQDNDDENGDDDENDEEDDDE